MTQVPEFMPPALSTKEIYARQTELARNKKPSTFKLSAQLLDQGRTDTPLAATDDLVLRLKVYASGGENELHAHTEEDHSFIILQGTARFHGPDGEMAELGANEGVMLPKGSFYRFNATGAEPLVILRVSSPNQGPDGGQNRIDRDGAIMQGDSKANRTVAVRFREDAYFG